MNYAIKERQEAVENAAESFNWYEDQSEGLGHAFLTELDAFYDTLERNPKLMVLSPSHCDKEK